MPKMQRSPPNTPTAIQNQNLAMSQSSASTTCEEPEQNEGNLNVARRKKRQQPYVEADPLVMPSSSSNPVTLDQISELLDRKLSRSSSFMITLHESLKTMISKEIGAAIQEVKVDFTRTTDLLCDGQRDAEAKISENEKKIKSLEADKNDLQGELRRLSGRLISMEKISRDLNLELQGVPEHRGENALHLFKELCISIDTPMSDDDVRACRRVAKMNASSPHPRNILISLASPRLRDNVLSAAHRFNKSNPKNQLNCSHIGMTGDISRIYVKEHLSPETKQLHGAARKFKNDKNYKYVWVRNGQVYLRKADDTAHIHVKNLDILKNLE